MTEAITPATFSFFTELAADNTRAFWQANSARMEAEVKAPFGALVTMLEASFGPFKTFRMHRDTRFSADKSPYKTMMGAVDRQTGFRYVHFDADGILIVGGAYILGKDQLSGYRTAVASEATGPQLVGILETLQATGIQIDSGGAAPLKSAPRGFDKDHPRIELLRFKGLMASRRLPAKTTPVSTVAATVMDFWNESAPLIDWLSDQT